eukprot:15453541-Alexandrium_andersonii.AAC.1
MLASQVLKPSRASSTPANQAPGVTSCLLVVRCRITFWRAVLTMSRAMRLTAPSIWSSKAGSSSRHAWLPPSRAVLTPW